MIRTKQEMFDKVAVHLLTQKYKSMRGDDECMYRGPNNTKCAIGCLIPDDIYNMDMEGTDPAGLRSLFNIRGGKMPWTQNLDSFALELQMIHDYEPVDKWFNVLTELADNRKVKTTIMEQFAKT